MSFLKPDPPTPPNPLATAAAQTGTNVSTAIANAYLNSTNQVTPTGSLTYNNTGNFPYTDPTTGQTFQIPRFTATQALSPNQQTLQNLNESAKIGLAGLSSDQADAMRQYFQGGFDPFSGAPASPDTATLNDTGLDRQRVEAALQERINPQLDRARNQLEQRLADQGIRYGSPAYSDAMLDLNRMENDARLGVIQAGGAEQQRLFQQAQAKIAAQSTARTQYMQEQYARRAQPIQEISALLSQGQVSLPQWIQTAQQQIPTTDIAGLINQNFNQQFQNYQNQQQATNQLLGGVLGAGGKLGAAIIQSDRRLKKNIHRIGTVFAAEPQPVEEPAKKKLPVYEYSYKDDPASKQHIGPMAQDVEKVDPEAVIKDRKGMRYINAPRVMGSILRAA